MTTFKSVRRSQVHYLVKTPLYVRNEGGDYVLYKSENAELDAKRFTDEAGPRLFVPEADAAAALSELHHQLRKKLLDRIKSGDLKSVKRALCTIVKEAFEEPVEENIEYLSETIEVIYDELSGSTAMLKHMVEIQQGGYNLAEHSVNVMVLVFNFCMFSRFDDKQAKLLSLCALLHDIGLMKIPKEITAATEKLTNAQFKQYQTHPLLGHKMITQNKRIDSAIAQGILEHHERLDGRGYPTGIADISFAGRLIGILDSFDNLTNTHKTHRKKEEPFGALKIIQNEMLKEGKFDKEIFRDLCLSLIGKKSYSAATC